MSFDSPRTTVVSALQALLFSLIISLGAQLDIDIAGLLPLTGQTLVILTGALLLPLPSVLVGLGLYFLTGIAGLPVFADGHSGWESFSGGSLGYFIGFLVATIVLCLSRKYIRGRYFPAFLALLVGHSIVLFMGSGFLLRYYVVWEAWQLGFQPFLVGALFKSFLGAVIYGLFS